MGPVSSVSGRFADERWGVSRRRFYNWFVWFGGGRRENRLGGGDGIRVGRRPGWRRADLDETPGRRVKQLRTRWHDERRTVPGLEPKSKNLETVGTDADDNQRTSPTVTVVLRALSAPSPEGSNKSIVYIAARATLIRGVHSRFVRAIKRRFQRRVRTRYVERKT